MERQLKERLIGAAVLLAVAVIMVPEMFSGGHSRAPSVDGSTQPLQTYRIDLQAAKREVVEPDPVKVAAPAERPQSEAQSQATSNRSLAESSSSQSLAASQPETQPSEVQAPASKAAAKPPEVKMAEAKSASTAPEPKSVASEAANEWQVQVGSFGTETKARQIATALKAQGFASTVAPVKVADKTLYRVRVAAGVQRTSADAMLHKLKDAYPGASVVAANR